MLAASMALLSAVNATNITRHVGATIVYATNDTVAYRLGIQGLSHDADCNGRIAQGHAILWSIVRRSQWFLRRATAHQEETHSMLATNSFQYDVMDPEATLMGPRAVPVGPRQSMH